MLINNKKEKEKEKKKLILNDLVYKTSKIVTLSQLQALKHSLN
jgi:hypothetical protein